MAKPGTLQEKNWEKDRKASVRPKKTVKDDKKSPNRIPRNPIHDDIMPPEEKA